MKKQSFLYEDEWKNLEVDCRYCLFYRGYCVLDIEKESIWDECKAFKPKIKHKEKRIRTLKKVQDQYSYRQETLK